MCGKISFTELRTWLRTHREQTDAAEHAKTTDSGTSDALRAGHSNDEDASAGLQPASDEIDGEGQARPEVLNNVLAKQVVAANQSLYSAHANVRKLYKQDFAGLTPRSQPPSRSLPMYGSAMEGR